MKEILSKTVLEKYSARKNAAAFPRVYFFTDIVCAGVVLEKYACFLSSECVPYVILSA